MPVRRKRRRYLRIYVTSDRLCTEHEVSEAITNGVLHLYGIHGLSKTEPLLIEFDIDEQTGIVRCSHLNLRQMRASLAYVTNVGESAASIHVLNVSGTIKALKRRKA
jgi:RNase P/RNase MRP subunit POP5